MADFNIETVLSFILSGQGNLTTVNQTLNQTIININNASTAAGSMSTSMQLAAASLQRIGSMLSEIGDAILGALDKATDAAAKFQDQMTLLETQAGVAGDQIAGLKNQVLALAPALGTAPEELAKGLYHIESAGISGSQAMDVLTTSAKLAKVGMAGMEETTNALVAVLRSGIGGIKDFNDAAGQMNAVIGAGNMRMSDLNASLRSGVLSVAKTLGLSFRDVGAALADMTDQGQPAEQAATRLKTAFTALAAPNEKAQKLLSGIGLSSTQLANDMRQPNGLLVALRDLKAHLEASGKSAVEAEQLISGAFGGGLKGSAIMTLLGSLDLLNQKYQQIATGAQKFGDAWQKTTEKMSFQFDRLKAVMGDLLIKLGDALAPLVAAFASGLEWIAAKFNALSPSAMQAIGIVAALGGVVAVVFGGLLTFAGVIVGLSLAVSALGVGVAGVGTAALFSIPGIAAMGTALWAALAPALPVLMLLAAGILLVVAAVKLLIDNWQKLKDINEGAKDWAKGILHPGEQAAQDRYNAGPATAAEIAAHQRGGGYSHAGETVTPAAGEGGDLTAKLAQYGDQVKGIVGEGAEGAGESGGKAAEKAKAAEEKRLRSELYMAQHPDPRDQSRYRIDTEYQEAREKYQNDPALLSLAQQSHDAQLSSLQREIQEAKARQAEMDALKTQRTAARSETAATRAQDAVYADTHTAGESRARREAEAVQRAQMAGYLSPEQARAAQGGIQQSLKTQEIHALNQHTAALQRHADAIERHRQMMERHGSALEKKREIALMITGDSNADTSQLDQRIQGHVRQYVRNLTPGGGIRK